MFALMRQLLIINADIDKTPTTAALINAYKEGAQAAEAVVKEIAIADLKFNPNKQFTLSNNEPEQDLVQAVSAIKWSYFVRFIKIRSTQKLKGFLIEFLCPTRFLSAAPRLTLMAARAV
jgi:hypothetical protein